MFGAEKVVMLAGKRPGPVQPTSQRRVKDVIDECAFSAAGDARNADEASERNAHINSLEIVRPDANAALRACKLTVSRAMSKAMPPARVNTHQLMSMRYA